MLLSVHVTRVLFLVLVGNSALTMDFYWNYMLLLQSPVLMCSCYLLILVGYHCWLHYTGKLPGYSLLLTLLVFSLGGFRLHMNVCKTLTQSGPIPQHGVKLNDQQCCSTVSCMLPLHMYGLLYIAIALNIFVKHACRHKCHFN